MQSLAVERYEIDKLAIENLGARICLVIFPK